MRFGRTAACRLVCRNMKIASWLVDRQIDKELGLKRCESSEVLEISEPIHVTRLTEFHMRMSE